MPNSVNLYAESDADMTGDDTTPVLTLKNTSTGAGLRVQNTPAGNATQAALQIGVNSVASAPSFGLIGGAFVSAVSLIFAAGANWAGMGAIRVVRTDGTFGWIPVLPDGQVTAAAK